MTLREHLTHRFTAKWWDPKPIEQEKLDAILNTVYLSPSKQGVYRYEVFVITDSPEGKDFKQWLYEHNTWCFEGALLKNGEGDRRFNGQVLAPVVLLFMSNKEQHNDLEDLNLRNHTDAVIASTIAMCAAQELGLSTGFNATFGSKAIEERLNRPDLVCNMILGVGYATPDQRVRRGIYNEDGQRIGYDYSNTDPDLKIDINRTQKSEFNKFFNVV